MRKLHHGGSKKWRDRRLFDDGWWYWAVRSSKTAYANLQWSERGGIAEERGLIDSLEMKRKRTPKAAFQPRLLRYGNLIAPR